MIETLYFGSGMCFGLAMVGVLGLILWERQPTERGE